MQLIEPVSGLYTLWIKWEGICFKLAEFYQACTEFVPWVKACTLIQILLLQNPSYTTSNSGRTEISSHFLKKVHKFCHKFGSSTAPQNSDKQPRYIRSLNPFWIKTLTILFSMNADALHQAAMQNWSDSMLYTNSAGYKSTEALWIDTAGGNMSTNVGCGPCRGCGRLMSHLNQMDKLHTVILGHFQGEHQQKPVKKRKTRGA